MVPLDFGAEIIRHHVLKHFFGNITKFCSSCFEMRFGSDHFALEIELLRALILGVKSQDWCFERAEKIKAAAKLHL